MSSLTLSGVVWSLRITLALPVTVATLPIGSSGASAAVASGVAGSGAAAAGAADGEGSVCACANCVRPDEAAEALVAPIVVLQANSMSAKDNWRCIEKFRVGGGQGAKLCDFSLRFQPLLAERGMNGAVCCHGRPKRTSATSGIPGHGAVTLIRKMLSRACAG